MTTCEGAYRAGSHTYDDSGAGMRFDTCSECGERFKCGSLCTVGSIPTHEASAPRTRIRWERGVAGQVAAHLLSDDGGHALVHCMIPGGTPRFLPRLDSRWDTAVVDAPACDTFAAFKAFVTERFGDDQTGHIATEPGKPCKACAAIGRLTWLEDDGSCRRADVHR